MGIFGSKKLVYRIRIFDNYQHLMTAEVPDKGQRYVTATVQKDLFGFGDVTKLAFMISPDIKPFIFGHVQEINFDVRDATPLGDLLDVAPNLIFEINERYKLIKELRDGKGGFHKTGAPGEPNTEDPGTPKKENPAKPEETPGVIDAEYTLKPEVEPLTDQIDPNAKPKDDRAKDDKRNFDPLIRGAKDAFKVAEGMTRIKMKGNLASEDEFEQMLALCQAYPKLLYWLPKHLKREPEVAYLVSQSRVGRVGVMPQYYHAQTGAMISEKTLTRPREKQGWEQVALILGAIALVVVMILGTLYFLTR